MNRPRKAEYALQTDGLKVHCRLCPHSCILSDGQSGICRVRINQGGVLYASAWGRLCTIAIDPIEKKPLYHFFPGSKILSIGSYGCNLQCRCCQNWQISQSGPAGVSETDPTSVVRQALHETGNLGIAYTYNEPLINIEYVLETARQANRAYLKNVMVTNGFIHPGPLGDLLTVIDAFNVDLKGFSEDFYRQFTGGRLQAVLHSLSDIRKSGKHLEITMLVIPGENDSPGEFSEMIHWISNELGAHTVLHLSRYFPRYRHEAPPTSPETMYRLYDMAAAMLPFVYLGNMPGTRGSDTHCPGCGALAIARNGYHINAEGLDESGKCRECGADLQIIL